MIDYDIAIIGASLAGSSAAIPLAKAGYKVVLLDSQNFPRPKCCGEGMSAQGLRALEKLGITVDPNTFHPLAGFFLDWGDAVPIVQLAHASGSVAGVERSKLDSLMVRTAIALPTLEFLNSTVKQCEQGRDSCTLYLASGERLTARYVIAASGSGTQFRRKQNRPGKPNRYAYSQHFTTRGAQISRVGIFLRPGYEVYCTPVNASTLNVAVLGNKSVFKTLRAPKGQSHILEMIQSQTGLELEPASDILSTALSTIRRPSTEGRIFFVGDACEQLDPIGGMGMTHALLSSQQAVEAVSALLEATCTLDQARERYNASRNLKAKSLRGFTRLTYWMLVTLGKTELSRKLSASPVARRLACEIHQPGKGPSAHLSRALLSIAGL